MLGMSSDDALTIDVREVVAETLAMPLHQVGLDADLEGTLGIDSLKLIELNVALETRFGVPILDFTASEEGLIRSVGDLVAFVRARLNGGVPR
jgi:acyl carrier protein